MCTLHRLTAIANAADSAVGDAATQAVILGKRSLMLETVHGDVIGAARTHLRASSFGQVDPRSSARTQDPRHQAGQGRVGDATGCRRVG